MSLTLGSTTLTIWGGNFVEETHIFHLRNATQWCCAEECCTYPSSGQDCGSDGRLKHLGDSAEDMFIISASTCVV